MSKISQIISQNVISIYDLSIVGIVKNVVFNERLIPKYIIIYNEQEDLEYILNIKNVYSIGTDAIIIRNKSYLNLLENYELALQSLFNPINYPVYNFTGKQYGKIIDIELDETGNTNNVITSNTTLDYKKCIFSKNKLVLYNDGPKKLKLGKFKPVMAIKKTSDNQIVTIQEKQQFLPPLTPQRQITNYTFLIGRMVTKDILSLNNEVIVKNGSLINSFVLDKIKNAGKLKELTTHSKTIK